MNKKSPAHRELEVVSRLVSKALDEAKDRLKNVIREIDDIEAMLMERLRLIAQDPASIEVAEAGFSVRARKALSRLDVATLGEISQYTVLDVLGVRNCGLTTTWEIRNVLSRYGLKLKDD